MEPTPRPLPRREFLARLAALGPAATLLPSPNLLAATRPGGASSGPSNQGAAFRIDLATCGDFARHLGSRFRIRLGSGDPVIVELARTIEPPRPPLDGVRPTGRTPFFLVFRGAEETGPEPGIYRVEHACLGRFELFLVPFGQEPGVTKYEAVFG